MKKILVLAFLMPFAACKKNNHQPAAPDITENVSLSIVNQNPDGYDTARGHVSDAFTWSIPNAYGDTVITQNANRYLLEALDYIYGSGDAFEGQVWLSINSDPVHDTVGLLIGFPSDTANLSLGYQYVGQSGEDVVLSDTVAATRQYGTGISHMLNWWRNAAIPVNDSVTNYVNINTNPLMLNVYDTLTFTSKGYVGDELVVSGTFSERMYTALAFTYDGSFCRKSWYLKGTFSNLIYVFTH